MKGVLKNIVLGCVVFAAYSVVGAHEVFAAWIPLSGPNYSQVAVASLVNGGTTQGLMCAVAVGNYNDWGGRIDCYRPSGTTGSVLTAVGSSAFLSTNPNYRIESFVIQPGAGGFTIHVLRSDKVVVKSFLPVPLQGHGLEDWYYEVMPGAAIPRQLGIALVNGSVDVVAVATDNLLYANSNGSWVRYGDSSPHVIINTNGGLLGSLLNGTDGLSTTFGLIGLTLGGPPPSAPSVLPYGNKDMSGNYTTDPNRVFYAYGKTTPVSCDASYCYMVDGSINSPIGRFSASIYRSKFSFSLFGGLGFGAWEFYPTDPEDSFSNISNPWSIQNGTAYRGTTGEIFVIGGGFRLLDWIP